MKVFLFAGALLMAQSTWAASQLRVAALDCTALNSLGYASLKLDKSDVVSITVNSAFSSLAACSPLPARRTGRMVRAAPRR